MTKSIDYVIPTWNSASTLQLTLQSIKRYGFPGKIVVVDRESQDETRAVAEGMGCQVVSFSGPLGAARRFGAGLTSTATIAYVDSDVELTEDWKAVLDAAWSGAYQDAGAIGAYYRGTFPSGGRFPIRLKGGNGAFGCMATFRNLMLEFQELDKYSSSEDRAYAKFLGEKGLCWYILPVELPHHHGMIDISEDIRWRWLGAGLRVMEGFRLYNVKKIMGGAILGIKMHDESIGYWENFRIRYHYFMGYLRYRKYYEIDRSGVGRVD